MKSFKHIFVNTILASSLAVLVVSCTKEEKKIKEAIESESDKEARSWDFGPDPTDN